MIVNKFLRVRHGGAGRQIHAGHRVKRVDAKRIMMNSRRRARAVVADISGTVFSFQSVFRNNNPNTKFGFNFSAVFRAYGIFRSFFFLPAV